MLTDEAVRKVYEDLGLETQGDRDRFLFVYLNARQRVLELIGGYETSDTAGVESRMEATQCRQTGANS